MGREGTKGGVMEEVELNMVPFFDLWASGEVYIGMRDVKAKTVIASRRYKDEGAANRALVKLFNLTRNERLEIIETGILPTDDSDEAPEQRAEHADHLRDLKEDR